MSPRPDNEDGSVTIEAAIATGVLVVVFAAIVAGVATLAAYISAIDTAGATARAHAIGVDYPTTTPRGEITVDDDGELVTVTVTIGLPIGALRATAMHPVEIP